MSLPKDNKDSIPEPVKGLEGIVAADTHLRSVNGENGILRYCGYNIDDLALILEVIAGADKFDSTSSTKKVGRYLKTKTKHTKKKIAYISEYLNNK